MLYVVSKEYGAALGEGFWVRPYLAAADPVWADDYLTCNITLRNDVYWHDIEDIWTDPDNPQWYTDEIFDADDVVMTFDAMMTPATGAWSEGDYMGVLDTTAVTGHPGGVEKLEQFKVRFHLEKPYVELKDLLANEWGSFILPEHILGSVPFKDWYGHWTNTEFPPPGTGPYRWVEHNLVDNYWRMEKVENYSTGLNPYGYGEVVPDEIIGYQITDMSAGWTALMNHDIHFGYGSWDATPDQINTANATGEFWVFDSPIPAVRYLCFNLNHPILSNRYVRQAIGHAMNYPKIVNDILPLYALNGHLQGTTVWRSLEQFYPTEAEMVEYNIGPYPYDIDLAQQYMDMWKYSLSANAPEGSPEVLLGPVGDSDFSGLVELDDFFIWAENAGTAPDDWLWYSGQDIDPDADNNDYVELADFYDWRENQNPLPPGAGPYYPFYGAR
jgi:ABC-type transport system substrate-binding protein